VENATRLLATLTAYTHFALVDHRDAYRGRPWLVLQQGKEPGRCLRHRGHKAVENAARLLAALTAYTHFVHPLARQL
jgi:hypothetical protein